MSVMIGERRPGLKLGAGQRPLLRSSLGLGRQGAVDPLQTLPRRDARHGTGGRQPEAGWLVPVHLAEHSRSGTRAGTIGWVSKPYLKPPPEQLN